MPREHPPVWAPLLLLSKASSDLHLAGHCRSGNESRSADRTDGDKQKPLDFALLLSEVRHASASATTSRARKAPALDGK